MSANNFIDLTGLLFGRLRVIEQAARLKKKVPRWLCQCDCGGSVVAEGKNLRGGLTKSCGCLSKEVASLRTRTHGMTESVEYKTWSAIKRRCYNENEHCYPRYGGRGIKVCGRWLNSFENFYADMGPRPAGNYSIERNDPNGDYSPSNCRWLPMAKQSANRRNSLRATLNGVTRLITEWAEITGIPYATLQARIDRGWDDARLLTTPLMKQKRNKKAGINR